MNNEYFNLYFFIGVYNRDQFYETYPDLEVEAKLYALENANKREATFTVQGLAAFITRKFKQLYPEHEFEGDQLIRSESICRVDVINWGARWDNNKNRPYFEGHERPDVVLHREQFLNYFL